MPTDTEVFINRLAQQVVDLEEGLRWFGALAPDAQKSALQTTWFFAAQAGASDDDADAAIVRARLKPTFTPCVLVTNGALKVQVGKIVRLPAAEREKSFRLLLALFHIADERRRLTSCLGGCTHWWHAAIQRS